MKEEMNLLIKSFRSTAEAEKQGRMVIGDVNYENNFFSIFSALPEENIYQYIGKELKVKLIGKYLTYDIKHAGYDIFRNRFIVVQRSEKEIEMALKTIGILSRKYNIALSVDDRDQLLCINIDSNGYEELIIRDENEGIFLHTVQH